MIIKNVPFSLGRASLFVLITVPFSNPILSREIRAINNSLYDASFVLQSVKHGRSWKRSVDTGQQVEVPQRR